MLKKHFWLLKTVVWLNIFVETVIDFLFFFQESSMNRKFKPRQQHSVGPHLVQVHVPDVNTIFTLYCCLGKNFFF